MRVCIVLEIAVKIARSGIGDRVIRFEMNVNPLNTIPGQNTATRGTQSGQIRYTFTKLPPLPSPKVDRRYLSDPSTALSASLTPVEESEGALSCIFSEEWTNEF